MKALIYWYFYFCTFTKSSINSYKYHIDVLIPNLNLLLILIILLWISWMFKFCLFFMLLFNYLLILNYQKKKKNYIFKNSLSWKHFFYIILWTMISRKLSAYIYEKVEGKKLSFLVAVLHFAYMKGIF